MKFVPDSLKLWWTQKSGPDATQPETSLDGSDQTHAPPTKPPRVSMPIKKSGGGTYAPARIQRKRTVSAWLDENDHMESDPIEVSSRKVPVHSPVCHCQQLRPCRMPNMVCASGYFR